MIEQILCIPRWYLHVNSRRTQLHQLIFSTGATWVQPNTEYGIHGYYSGGGEGGEPRDISKRINTTVFVGVRIEWKLTIVLLRQITTLFCSSTPSPLLEEQ